MLCFHAFTLFRDIIFLLFSHTHILEHICLACFSHILQSFSHEHATAHTEKRGSRLVCCFISSLTPWAPGAFSVGSQSAFICHKVGYMHCFFIVPGRDTYMVSAWLPSGLSLPCSLYIKRHVITVTWLSISHTYCMFTQYFHFHCTPCPCFADTAIGNI